MLLLFWPPAELAWLVSLGSITLMLIALGSYGLWRGTWVTTLDRMANAITVDRTRIFQDSYCAAEWEIQDISDVLVVKSVNPGGKRKYHVYVRLTNGQRERLTRIARSTRDDYQEMINIMHQFLFQHAPARHKHRSPSL